MASISRFQSLSALFLSGFISVSAWSQAETFSLSLANTATTPALQNFLSDVGAHLPPRMKQVLNKNISVKFYSFPALASTSNCAVQSNLLQGQTHGSHEIALNAALIPEINKGSAAATAIPCGHKDLYDVALAAAIHQLASLYDDAGDQSADKIAETQYCQTQLQDHDNHPSLEKARCQNLVSKTRSVSNDPFFLSITDWDLFNRPLNQSVARSPDPSEEKSPENSFAVNMEYFLTDPEFACRRPSEQAYLRDHFAFDPFPNRTCQMPTELDLTRDSFGQTAGSSKVILDPKRIYQIQFLFASPGSQAMSAWGHAMFRLIVCSPGHEVGPKCLYDIQDHVVISFRANPGNWFIDSWKGLTGYYPSEMFLYHFFPNIMNEYTVDEFRDLYSLPLKLTEEQKNLFVQRVVEQYWQYQGKYYFATNNCATEALRLLRGVVPDWQIQSLMVYTPSGLFEYLGKTHMIDMSLLNGPQAAAYKFGSQKAGFDKAFGLIQQLAPQPLPFQTMEDFTTKSSAQYRHDLFNQIVATGKTGSERVAAEFLLLETYINRKDIQNFFSGTINQLGHVPGAAPAPAAAQAGGAEMQSKFDNLAQAAVSDMPWNQKAGGYGAQLDEDHPQPVVKTPVAGAAAAPAIKSLYGDVMGWANQNLPAQAKELNVSTANINFFRQQQAPAH